MTSSERLCAQPTEDAPRAPDLSRFARELRVRQQNRRVGPVWQKTSPSTQQILRAASSGTPGRPAQIAVMAVTIVGGLGRSQRGVLQTRQ
jgi:hypothetical protein